ncbi:MAG: thioredoxin [Oscillospiraceae bacterium]|nr:thioredoxin [Oscillospiraceae bacterium]
MVTVVTQDNFMTEVLEADKPVLVDFWAVWCGPCKMLSPVVDQIAEENDDIKVCKIDVDEEGALAQQFGIMSIPSLLVFKGGEVVERSVGVQPKDAVLAMVKKHA